MRNRNGSAVLSSAEEGQDGPVPRPPRLSPDEIAAALHGLPMWSGDGDGLRRTVELPSFRDAVAAVVAIADISEEMDHHPDVDLRYRTLHLTLVSHSAGGVSDLDLQLARRIDELLLAYLQPLYPAVTGSQEGPAGGAAGRPPRRDPP